MTDKAKIEQLLEQQNTLSRRIAEVVDAIGRLAIQNRQIVSLVGIMQSTVANLIIKINQMENEDDQDPDLLN